MFLSNLNMSYKNLIVLGECVTYVSRMFCREQRAHMNFYGQI